MKYLISFDTNIVRQDQASEWGVDKVLTLGSDLNSDLSNLPIDTQSVVFFVPTVLDYNNSLAYDGANLALRIMMHHLKNGIVYIDIVLMGNESEARFLLHYDYPNILSIPGVHYVLFNKKTVASYEIPRREQLKANEYKPYLDNLGLKIPSSFKSTHSLTNEWCLFKWNSFMGFKENTTSLDGHLYFEYLITVEKLCSVKNKTVTEHLKKRISNFPASRILVVDDKDGWHRFFKEMFSNANEVEVHCIGGDFNKLNFAAIGKRIADEVNDFKPHVIILDFRLMEDTDAGVKDDMKQISGYQVLAKILKGKYTNPLESFGRQTIIFTATSRIENILLLKEGNADGFILKEKPENYAGKEITKNIISKMISNLITAIERAYFLIPFNEKLDRLTHLITEGNTNTSLNLISAIQNSSQVVRQLCQSNSLDKDILKLVYLNIFNVFEDIKRDENFIDYPNQFTLVVKGINDLVISGKSKCAMSSSSDDDWNYKPVFTPSSRHEKFCKDKSLNFAICALILFRLGKEMVDDTDWNSIRLIRNAIAHGDDDKLKRVGLTLDIVTLKLYIIKMLDLILAILDKESIKEISPILKR